MNYSVRYVHKISPSDKDVGPVVTLGFGDLLDRKSIGRALRERKLICAGQRVAQFRVEASGRVVAFPAASIWHSIILTPVQS